MNSKPNEIKYRIITFYMIISVDLIFQTFIEFTFSGTLESFNSTITIIILIVQAFLTLATMIWFFILLWQTILFQFGMIGKLVSEFKWSFLVILINLVLFGLERVIKFTTSLSKKTGSFVYLVDDTNYQIVFMIRFIFNVIYYFTMINTGLQVTNPIYYKIEKWFK